jgi:hypothetical protein
MENGTLCQKYRFVQLRCRFYKVVAVKAEVYGVEGSAVCISRGLPDASHSVPSHKCGR